jgi:response regulator RpfG family c-di-GMP phosphodiesterase
MTNTCMDVLLVGERFHVGAQALTERLRRSGFRCHFAGTMQVALEFLKSRGVDVVISEMHLSDGSGVGLVATLAGLPVTAFLCVPVEDSCLWLPAIDRGRDCWGREMLRPPDFARALEELAQQGPAAPLVSLPIPRGRAA